MAQNKGSDKSPAEKRKGGLGRGLAALIPSGPTDSPGLGGGAADIILGGAVGERARRRPDAAPRPGLPPITKPDTPARPEGAAPRPGPVRTPEQQPDHTPSHTASPTPTP